MDLSIIMAKVLAVYLVISGFFLITRRRTLAMLLKDFFGHPSIVYFAGVMLTMFGLVMMFRTDAWNGGWRNWMTIFGLLMFIKGMAYIFIPRSLSRLHIEHAPWLVVLGGALGILLGGWLFWISH